VAGSSGDGSGVEPAVAVDNEREADDSSGDEPSDAVSSDEAGTAGSTAPRASEEPDWVTRLPERAGNIYRRTVVSEPYSTNEECYEQLEHELMVATGQYLDDLVGSGEAPEHGTRRLERLGINAGYVRANICEDDYREYLDSSVNEIAGSSIGAMRRIHVLLEFDEAVQSYLKREWKDHLLEERLAVVGGGAMAVLSLVGLVFAYLRIDTATRGFYTRHLQVAAGIVTLLIIAITVAFLASW
jgi:hypothetical protein